jgi:integrase
VPTKLPAALAAAMQPAAAAARGPADRARNPYHAYLTRLDRDESRRTMRGCLGRVAELVLPGVRAPEGAVLAEMVPWHAVGYAEAIALREVITGRARAKGWSVAHQNKHLAAVRGVITQSWELGYVDADTRARACKALGDVQGSSRKSGRHVEEDEVVRLLVTTAGGGRPVDLRDAAIIAVFHATGGRCFEVAAMRIERYNPATQGTDFAGKRGKSRDAFLHDDADRYVTAWLDVVGSARGPMFRPIDQHGNIRERALTPRSVGRIVDKRRRAAGLKKLATHDFRRTLVGDMLDQGVDVFTVQKTVGHASPVTTGGYDRRPARRVRAAVQNRNLAIHRAGASPSAPVIADAVRGQVPGVDDVAIGRVLTILGTEMPRLFPGADGPGWTDLAAAGRLLADGDAPAAEPS